MSHRFWMKVRALAIAIAAAVALPAVSHAAAPKTHPTTYASTNGLLLNQFVFQQQLLANRLRSFSGMEEAELVASLSDGAPALAQAYADAIVRGQDCCCGPVYSGWALGFGYGGHADNQSPGVDAPGIPGYTVGVGGVQFGIERQLTDCVWGGLYATLAFGSVDDRIVDHDVNLGSYQIGAYWNYSGCCDYAIVSIGAGWNAYESRRVAPAGAEPPEITANYGGWNSLVYLEYGRIYDVGCWRVLPYAALQYVHLRQDAFSETADDDSPALNVDAFNVDSLRGFLGVNANRYLANVGCGNVSVDVRAAWVYEFLGTNGLLMMQNTGFGPAFGVRGVDAGRDWALLGVGLNWDLNYGTRLFTGYDAQANTDQVLHMVSGGVEWRR